MIEFELAEDEAKGVSSLVKALEENEINFNVIYLSHEGTDLIMKIVGVRRD